MERVQGTTTTLWVSLHLNHRGKHPVPPETLTEPRGLYRAWPRAVEQTNAQMAGEPSRVPLPTPMEQFRCGVSPKTSPAHRQPDAEQASSGTTSPLQPRPRRGAPFRLAGNHRGTPEKIEQAMQLSALVEAGLTGTADLTAVGRCRPSKARAV
jgi:hypothetical protein